MALNTHFRASVDDSWSTQNVACTYILTNFHAFPLCFGFACKLIVATNKHVCLFTSIQWALCLWFYYMWKFSLQFVFFFSDLRVQTDETLSSPQSYLPIFIFFFVLLYMFDNMVEQKTCQKLINSIFCSLPKTELHVGRDVTQS